MTVHFRWQAFSKYHTKGNARLWSARVHSKAVSPWCTYQTRRITIGSCLIDQAPRISVKLWNNLRRATGMPNTYRIIWVRPRQMPIWIRLLTILRIWTSKSLSKENLSLSAWKRSTKSWMMIPRMSLWSQHTPRARCILPRSWWSIFTTRASWGSLFD